MNETSKNQFPFLTSNKQRIQSKTRIVFSREVFFFIKVKKLVGNVSPPFGNNRRLTVIET